LLGLTKEPKSVAVIDGDASSRVAMSRLLRGMGFEPSAYNSAENFLADPAHETFACLLLDLHLPGMSGLELQRQLLAAGNLTPLIFVTAQDDSAARERAIQNGAKFFRKVDPGAAIIDALRRASRDLTLNKEPEPCR
jgi:FixJ family two-component response regulator